MFRAIYNISDIVFLPTYIEFLIGVSINLVSILKMYGQPLLAKYMYFVFTLTRCTSLKDLRIRLDSKLMFTWHGRGIYSSSSRMLTFIILT